MVNRGKCSNSACRRRTQHKNKEGEFLCVFCDMALEDKLTDRQEKILDLIAKSSLSDSEINILLKSKPPRQVRPIHRTYFGKDKIRIGVVSDFHMGSKYFNEPGFEYCIERFNREKVDAIYFPGDILEGMSQRDGQIFELSEIGYTEQLNKAVSRLKKFKHPFYFITGNHDKWAKDKGNLGLSIGEEIERRVPNAKFLGEMEATVDLGYNIKMKLTHRGNSSTYALSYSGQRMINNIPGGEKPNIILNGHLHKSIYMYYRNIHYLEAGTLQNQTEFMKMKGAPANVGFWIIDIELGNKGVTGFKPSWYPIFE